MRGYCCALHRLADFEGKQLSDGRKLKVRDVANAQRLRGRERRLRGGDAGDDYE